MAEQVGHFIAPVVTLFYCLSFTIAEVRLLLHGWRTRNWPRVDGTILHSETQTGISGGRYAPSLSYPSVIYRYTVSGTDYHGNHLGYRGGVLLNWRDNPWTAGQHVSVWYDPAHPSRSVLRAGTGFSNYLGTALGLAALTLAFWWLAWNARAA